MEGVHKLGISALGLLLAGSTGHFATAQSTVHKTKSARKTTMAEWTPEVQQTLGVSSSDFKMTGLNRLTATQLQSLEAATRAHPNVPTGARVLTCPVGTRTAGSPVRVFVTVLGDDPTGARKTELMSALRGLNGVTLVDSTANADRTLRVVIQEQSMGKRTIGYTASYMTGTPCVETTGGKKTDVEIKEQLGTYTDPKGSDLAQDLTRMLARDLQPLQQGAAASQ